MAKQSKNRVSNDGERKSVIEVKNMDTSLALLFASSVSSQAYLQLINFDTNNLSLVQ